MMEGRHADDDDDDNNDMIIVVIKRDGRAILSRLEYGVWYIRKVYLAFGVT